jgi:hypothetical protein
MNFQYELQAVKEFFYMSFVRYNLANNFLSDVQKRYPTSTDDKDFYIGSEVPTEDPPNYDLKIKVGDFKLKLEAQTNTLINNCVILLISAWEEYCKSNKLKKYYDKDITEVILYRNCLVHNKGIIDKEYINKSKLHKYELGDKLNFLKKDFDLFLTYFEKK